MNINNRNIAIGIAQQIFSVLYIGFCGWIITNYLYLFGTFHLFAHSLCLFSNEFLFNIIIYGINFKECLNIGQFWK